MQILIEKFDFRSLHFLNVKSVHDNLRTERQTKQTKSDQTIFTQCASALLTYGYKILWTLRSRSTAPSLTVCS